MLYKFISRHLFKMLVIFLFLVLPVKGDEDIAIGRNYLALSADEIYRANLKFPNQQEESQYLSFVVSRRALLLCLARGYKTVVSLPRLTEATPDTPIGPWADNFADLNDPMDIWELYQDTSLDPVSGFDHLVFLQLKCGSHFESFGQASVQPVPENKKNSASLKRVPAVIRWIRSGLMRFISRVVEYYRAPHLPESPWETHVQFGGG